MSIKVYLSSALQAFLAFGPSSYRDSSPQLPLTPFAGPVVDLGYSQYQGSANATTNTTNFFGLRYAAPPLGNLRWAAPQPPLATSGIQDATKQPNGCYTALPGIAPDNPSFGPTDNESEDCLFVNVHVPGTTVTPAPSGGGLPVVVWFHGGGYIAGAAKDYDGSDLVKASNNGVITVIMQYRLGVFGFLAGSAVKQGGALNAGLLDQNYVLQWVQTHISSFGGDPSRVTLWGESAGGGSVLQQLVAHGGNTQPPLFKAAITSSPFLPSQYPYNHEKPESLYSKVVAGVNCNTAPDTLACLRAADAQAIQIMNVKINVGAFYGTFTFVPVVDGEFIVERPTETMSKGKMNGERLMAVHNTNEGNLFVNQLMQLTLPQYLQRLFPYFGNQQIAGAAAMYQSLGPSVQQANAAIGEAMFICPAYYLLQAYGNQTWKGHFALPPALHIDDVSYYFTSQGPPYKNPQFIQSFSNSFLAMVMYGTPDHRYNAGDITPTWNTWSSGYNEIVFDNGFLGRPNVYAAKTDQDVYNRCAYWRSVSGYTLQ